MNYKCPICEAVLKECESCGSGIGSFATKKNALNMSILGRNITVGKSNYSELESAYVCENCGHYFEFFKIKNP